MSSKLIAVSAAALLLGLSSPSFAQSFTLNGTDVPADQVERIQAHCDALEAAEMGSATDSSGAAGTSTSTDTAGSTSTDASASTSTDTAAGAATDAAAGATDAAAGAATDAAAGASTDAAGTSTSASTSATIDFATLYLATIDIEACRPGGFLDASSGMDSSTSTDAGAGTSTETTTK